MTVFLDRRTFSDVARSATSIGNTTLEEQPRNVPRYFAQRKRSEIEKPLGLFERNIASNAAFAAAVGGKKAHCVQKNMPCYAGRYFFGLELLARVELATSSLPRMCSTN